MATNRQLSDGRYVKLPVSTADYDSGDPVCLGRITGVAQADKDADNNVVIDRAGSYDLSVAGVNDAGNSAVAVGDAIYFVSGDTPVLSKKDSGVLFGFALETVTSGATATIEVLLAYGAAVTDHQHVLADIPAITASVAEINVLDGIAATLTAAELSILDGLTASTAELNILDGVTATAAELNLLDGAGAVVASGTTASHIAATKADYVASDIDDNGTINGTEVAVVLNTLAGLINGLNTDIQAFKIRAGE